MNAEKYIFKEGLHLRTIVMDNLSHFRSLDELIRALGK